MMCAKAAKEATVFGLATLCFMMVFMAINCSAGPAHLR